jgi:hypothetical protein
MKRVRIAMVLALTAALVALAPLSGPTLGAQNAAKRPMALDDILSFRAIGATSLAPNGQWFSYRLAPLQGDAETVVRSTSGSQ